MRYGSVLINRVVRFLSGFFIPKAATANTRHIECGDSGTQNIIYSVATASTSIDTDHATLLAVSAISGADLSAALILRKYRQGPLEATRPHSFAPVKTLLNIANKFTVSIIRAGARTIRVFFKVLTMSREHFPEILHLPRIINHMVTLPCERVFNNYCLCLLRIG